MWPSTYIHIHIYPYKPKVAWIHTHSCYVWCTQTRSFSLVLKCWFTPLWWLQNPLVVEMHSLKDRPVSLPFFFFFFLNFSTFNGTIFLIFGQKAHIFILNWVLPIGSQPCSRLLYTSWSRSQAFSYQNPLPSTALWGLYLVVTAWRATLLPWLLSLWNLELQQDWLKNNSGFPLEEGHLPQWKMT